jgi:hypothetical protein
LKQLFLFLQFGTAYLLGLFQFGHTGFQHLGLVAFALFEQLANLFGTLILLHQVVVQTFL